MKITKSVVDKISLMLQSGMSVQNIASVLNISESSAEYYKGVITSVMNGRPVALGRKYYSERAVREWAADKGYLYSRTDDPVQYEQMQIDATATTNETDDLIYFADAMIRLGYYIKDKLIAKGANA